MKAIVCRSLSSNASLRLEDLPEPPINPWSVRIRVRACGINFADSLITQGRYQVQPQIPFSPGFEVAGDILEIGEEVTRFTIGKRVIAITPYGGYAEQVVVPASFCVVMPESMPYEHGAAFPVVFGTSHIALYHRAKLCSGETLVVHGASGGVGLTAVTIGKKLGAKVIATASSQKKLAVARAHGADYFINTSRDSISPRIKEFTDGRGADVVYDPVGGELFNASLHSIAFEGRILVIGFAGGNIQQIPANYLLVKNIDVIGINWLAYAQRHPNIMSESLQILMKWYIEGTIKPNVSKIYPLELAVEALSQVLARKSIGKIVLKVAGE